MTLPLTFRFTTTAAPVQAEGTVDGHALYFRARNESWEFAVSEDPALDPAGIQSEEHGFYRTGPCPGGPRAASYLPLPEAEALIRRCASEYLESKGSGG
ncbi:MAG TPA: hypothetical protein VF710_14775 [Longimicrobium sp.]|jgi:hypothetical protein